jgi:hypothetical protein
VSGPWPGAGGGAGLRRKEDAGGVRVGLEAEGGG